MVAHPVYTTRVNKTRVNKRPRKADMSMMGQGCRKGHSVKQLRMKETGDFIGKVYRNETDGD